jgi:hypothetical protein
MSQRGDKSITTFLKKSLYMMYYRMPSPKWMIDSKKLSDKIQLD